MRGERNREREKDRERKIEHGGEREKDEEDEELVKREARLEFNSVLTRRVRDRRVCTHEGEREEQRRLRSSATRYKLLVRKFMERLNQLATSTLSKRVYEGVTVRRKMDNRGKRKSESKSTVN